ncbi:hypothetical protein U1Q18_003650 [Sarracenia purpurea var. burkii]
MTKKSRRRPVRYEKNRTGCMWGFISFFDFRHGRSTRRLLSDREHPSKQIGDGCSNLQMLRNSNEIYQEIYDGEERDTTSLDAAKISVKELMEEEMFSEQDQRKQDFDNSGSHVNKKRTRTSKTSKSSCDVLFQMGTAENLGPEKNFHHQDPVEKSSKLIDMEAVANELFHQLYQKSTNCMEHDWNNDLGMQSKETNSMFDEKLIEKIKVFVDQRLTDAKDERIIDKSEEFIEALQTSSANKALVLELLKDPKSLLVKQIEDLEVAQLEKDRNSNSLARSNVLDKELDKSKLSVPIASKHLNFFRRRSKSQEKILLKADAASNRIVILKPAPANMQVSETERKLSSSFQSHCDLGTKEQTQRIASQFSFTEIKRKLKNAMGKERCEVPSDDIACRFRYEHHNSGKSDKGILRKNDRWKSPNRNHFYNENWARPAIGIPYKDKICKPKATETSMGSENDGCSEQRVSDIYIEAKKHLSEILGNGDEIGDFSSRRLPKTLGRILSLPEFNSSPICSPKMDTEQSCSSQNLNSESCIGYNPEGKVQSCNSNSDVLDELSRANTEQGTLCSTTPEKISEVDVVIEQTTDALVQQGSPILDISAEQCSSPAIRNDQNSDLAKVCDEEESSQCLKSESSEEDKLLDSPLTSPPSSLITKHVGELERAERPSPVSVLEPFIEDDIIPARIKFQPFEPLMPPPLRIHVEEQLSSATIDETCVRACMEDVESAFEYVEVVLLASDLNWEQFLRRWISSDPILEPSLFDEVELFSNRPRHDQKLLFDCTNEVLEEFCERYFGFTPRVSFVKHNIRPLPRAKEVICEVWEGVEWHLLPQPFPRRPRTLDLILRKDMAKIGTWMDLRTDVKSVGTKIGDVIFEELVEDTISSFIDEDQETNHSVLSEDLIETEYNINSCENYSVREGVMLQINLGSHICVGPT